MVRGLKQLGAPSLIWGLCGGLACSSGEQGQESQSPLAPASSSTPPASVQPAPGVQPSVPTPSGSQSSNTNVVTGTRPTSIDGTEPNASSTNPAPITPPTSGTTGPEPEPAAPVDCDLIAAEGYQVCSDAADACGVVFTDGSGCTEVCAKANLRCAAAFEDVDGECSADSERPAVECDSGHQSDYCQCERDPAQPVSPQPVTPVTPVTPSPTTTSAPPDSTATSDTETTTTNVPPGDAPCAVPDYIFNDTSPIGWAAQGSGTSGGGNTEAVLVTSLSELQSAVRDANAKVVYVQGDFSPGSLDIGSNKTIIGCSSGAHIQGTVSIGSGSSNVILRNLSISGYGVGDCSKDPGFNSGEGCSSGSDAVGVNGNAHHVWVDHCSVKDGTDGNLDITNDADFVTVSWTKFSYTPRTDDVGNDSTGAAGHRFSNLVGGTDDAPSGWPGTRPLNVTWHHNWWADNVVERQPRVRFGRNHLFNNYYNSSASNYCVRAGIEASVLLQANAFDGVDSPHQFNSEANEKTAFIALGEGELVNAYADVSGERAEGGGGAGFEPPYDFDVDPADGVASAVTAGAGPH
jgi:pectate lyase